MNKQPESFRVPDADERRSPKVYFAEVRRGSRSGGHAVNDGAKGRIQRFRDRVAEHIRLRSATNVTHFMDAHQSWMRLAGDAERIERAQSESASEPFG